MTEAEIKAILEDTLRYLGHNDFNVWISAMKIVVTLGDNDKMAELRDTRSWSALYSRNNITPEYAVGALVCWLMNEE